MVVVVVVVVVVVMVIVVVMQWWCSGCHGVAAKHTLLVIEGRAGGAATEPRWPRPRRAAKAPRPAALVALRNRRMG